MLKHIIVHICTLGLASLLTACGSPSDAAIQATVAAAVQSTAEAEQIAASVKATQEAETACGALALRSYADTIENQMRAFEQQAQLVGTTPRVSLGVPLQRLLDIQTETRKLDTPSCLQGYHDQVLTMMELHQQGYQNFAAQGDNAVITTTLAQAKQMLDEVRTGLATLRNGSVPTVSSVATTTTP